MAKCYVCFDSGWVPYFRKYKDIKYKGQPVTYEYFAKCMCEAGKNIGNKIPSIDKIISVDELRKIHISNKKKYSVN